jgi:hypothetical protein
MATPSRPGPASAIAKVVARYRDGRVLKGFTRSFDPSRPSFRLQVLDAAEDAEPVEIAMTDLKAVFFVRDFAGNREYNEEKAFTRRPAGRIVEVAFFDGETLIGTSLTYDASRPGFFLFPADPRSNNERVYVVRSSTTRVSPVAPGTMPAPPQG